MHYHITNMKFCLMDISNLIHRSKHVVSHYDSFDDCVGMVLSIAFNSIRKSFQAFEADHVVACFDSKSWRKDVFEKYKADRVKDSSPLKIEQDEIIYTVIDDLYSYFKDRTNVTVLKADKIEADDFIARWIALHDDPSFEHVIVSSDGDFKQLIKEGVELYNPVSHTLYTTEGVYYDDGTPIRKDVPFVELHGQKWKIKRDKKTGEPVTVEPKWELFEKCIRGKKNNLPTAFPRVRSTKMREAFNDNGGEIWNNFINTMWGESEKRQYVRERYEFNKSLLDLTLQPEHIINVMDNCISEQLEKPNKLMITPHFLKFCGRYRLPKLGEMHRFYSKILSSGY